MYWKGEVNIFMLNTISVEVSMTGKIHVVIGFYGIVGVVL
jgi:hypothetical protein